MHNIKKGIKRRKRAGRDIKGFSYVTNYVNLINKGSIEIKPLVRRSYTYTTLYLLYIYLIFYFIKLTN